MRVPIRPHPLANPEKGTGIAMICTFGDVTDVTWWRELSLPVRAVLQPDGRLGPVTWGSAGWESRRADARRPPTISSRACRPARRARRSSSCCRRAASSIGDVRPITHPVKFYEKGDRPLEIVTSRQWFVQDDRIPRGAARARPGADAGTRRSCESRYAELGRRPDRRLVRQPPALLRRAVPGAGTRSTPTATPDTTRPDRRRRSRSCRSTRRPTSRPATRAEQRDQPGGFTGDPDVMDTWATSSLTPQIAGGWDDDPDLFARVFPMDLRPQAHEIIRTWLFYTVARAQFEHDSLPW